MLMTGYDFNAYVILVIFTERCDGKKEFEIIDNSYLALNPFTLRVFLESVVCYFHTFENNLEINQKFSK